MPLSFKNRHIGPSHTEQDEMLQICGYETIDDLINETIPKPIQASFKKPVSETLSEYDFLKHIKNIGNKNIQSKSFIGYGYYGTITPSVIQRCILENPGWYTQYTPYQPEISQGRLEALINFQTMVTELTK